MTGSNLGDNLAFSPFARQNALITRLAYPPNV